MAGIILDNYQPQVSVSGREGLKDMIIIDAIYQAIESGNKVKLEL